MSATISKTGGREQSGLLSRLEAAAYLGIKAATLAVWKCTGRYALPCVKVGGLAKYRLTDLDAFIASRTVVGGLQ